MYQGISQPRTPGMLQPALIAPKESGDRKDLTDVSRTRTLLYAMTLDVARIRFYWPVAN